MIARWKKQILLSFGALLLAGCEKNNDLALLTSYPAFGACAVDIPRSNERISNNQILNIVGWAFDEKNKSLPDILTLYLVNEETSKIFTFTARRGEQRPDVATVYNMPILVDSGFHGQIPENSLPPGTYRTFLLQADRQSGVISCNGLDHKFIIE